MKTSKSPENKEVTPSKKKLKQARLPFKLISDVSPTPAVIQTRKRKLSLPEPEPVTKVGKICKENDLANDLVVISDEESRDEQKQQEEVKPQNPYVKLVDTARKKKLQKKTLKKKSKSTKKLNGTTEKPIETVDDNYGDVEMVEVEVVIHEEGDEKRADTKNEDLPNGESTAQKDDDPQDQQTQKPIEIKSTENVSDVICLEDSNHSTDLHTEAAAKKTKDDKTNELEQNKIVNSEPVNTKENSDAESVETKEEINSLNDTQVTPKRSSRNKAKNEASVLNTSSSKLDESVGSNPSTPKRNTSSIQDESMNDSTVSANLTPKQLQKKLESAKKREEREKEKQEREKKRQQEKEERAKQRQEKEEQKKRERDEKEEAKKREKEEKEEQRRKEREEKEKQKEMEKKVREMKEEMKRKEKEDKEEQRKKEKEAREEEKRKRQEALEVEKQEQELKKKKAAEAFVNFFVPKQKIEKDNATGPVSKNSALSSFTIKVDMRLAPTTRVDLSEDKREALEKSMEEQNKSASYLKSLKEGTNKPLSSSKTWPLSDKDNDDDVMIVEDELPPIDGSGEIITCEPAAREKLRPKLFSFHENRRPPYWGTWRKKSSAVKPRRPFGQDEKQLDYEVDSDDDWEEEQEGESLDGSACGSDDEADRDDYEVDNELFVPHGYLSDEEATMDEDDVLSLSPETQKAKLKHLEDEFESEMKKPTEKLKPRLYGLLWESEEGGKPDKCVDALWNYFTKFAMIMNDPTPLLQPANEPEDSEKKKANKKKKKEAATTEGEESPKSEKKKKAESKESRKPKTDAKKILPNQPGINSFLKKLKTT